MEAPCECMNMNKEESKSFERHHDRLAGPVEPVEPDTGGWILNGEEGLSPLSDRGDSWASVPESPPRQESVGLDADAPRVPRAVGRGPGSGGEETEEDNDYGYDGRGLAGAGGASPHTRASSWEPRKLPEGRGEGPHVDRPARAHGSRDADERHAVRAPAPASDGRRRPPPGPRERGGRPHDTINPLSP